MSLEGKWIEVQGYKHDGRMHRIWDSVYVVEDNEEYIAVASLKTKVVEHDFRVWYTKEPAVMIFFKKRWRNVIAMLKKSGLTYYVNLASPYIIDNFKPFQLKSHPNTINIMKCAAYPYTPILF